MNNKKHQKKILPYTIPEFCLCEEVYNDVKSLVVAPSSYFKETGETTTIVLDSGTTIIKWPTVKAMKKKMKRKMKEIIQKCIGQ